MTSTSPIAGIRFSERPDGVGVITLSRPPVNALDWATKRSLMTLITNLRSAHRVRALVIASDLPRTFCAGSDLHELFADHGRPGSAVERTEFEFEMWQALSALPQPSIAAVEGHALGSGMEMCVACDFRIAGQRATFGLPEIKIGGAPGAQTLALLSTLIGLAATRRMLMTGDSIDADRAFALGFVDEVTPAGEALTVALTLAARLADAPRSSIEFIKASLAASVGGAIERVGPVVIGGVESLFLAPEMHEGIAAFREKRAPDFIGVAASGRPEVGG
ncbi:MAG: enoyl-CoA hydratase/isomerase family protein [Candidatus Limnocylindrales bacterium]